MNEGAQTWAARGSWLLVVGWLLGGAGCGEPAPPGRLAATDAGPAPGIATGAPRFPPPPAPPLSPECMTALAQAASQAGEGLISASPPSQPFELLLLEGTGRRRLAPQHLQRLTGEPTVAEDGPLPEAARPRLTQALRGQLAANREQETRGELTVDYPARATLFPPEAIPPTIQWHDARPDEKSWLVEFVLGEQARLVYLAAGWLAEPPLDPTCVTESNTYRPTLHQAATRSFQPDPAGWDAIKACSVEQPVRLRIHGFYAATPDQPGSLGGTTWQTSRDRVTAAIFYRDVPLPFRHAVKNIGLIRWRLGEIGDPAPPRTVLQNMPVCANCHSFTADGRTLAMDVDYASDKGSYAITAITPETLLERSKIISWSQFDPGGQVPTFGLLSQISPDGRYVASTVHDLSVFTAVPELYYSQLFFPIRGILAIYDRHTKRFFALPGADDPAFVQSNPVWSPDGRTLLFARAPAFQIDAPRHTNSAILGKDNLEEFRVKGKELQYDQFRLLVDGKTRFRYDLYRLPFNEGRGGVPEPLAGASANGRSNYFPRFSPDGRLLVFCQADSFMLLQQDSELYVMPAAGGTPRRLIANQPGGMNSWHSFSPDGRWLVFASKRNGPYTQLWLTHLDETGQDTPPVLLEQFTPGNRAANIPEFVPIPPGGLLALRETFTDHYNYFRQGYQYWKLSDFELAVELFRKALEKKPDDPESLEYLGRALEKLGRLTEAATALEAALPRAASPSSLRVLLGELAERQQRAGEAQRHYEQALQLNPRDPRALTRLAWLLATSPAAELRNGRRAVLLAERASQASRREEPDSLDALAAAYAEVGRFPDAVRTVSEALDRLPSKADPRAAGLRARLERYRGGQAYRVR